MTFFVWMSAGHEQFSFLIVCPITEMGDPIKLRMCQSRDGKIGDPRRAVILHQIESLTAGLAIEEHHRFYVVQDGMFFVMCQHDVSFYHVCKIWSYYRRTMLYPGTVYKFIPWGIVTVMYMTGIIKTFSIRFGKK